MRPENQRMAAFLKANGVKATPKYFATGSMRGTWRISNCDQRWTPEIRQKLADLGFVGLDGTPIGEFAGNGGYFEVFVRGHNEFLEEVEDERSVSKCARPIKWRGR